MTGLIWFVQVVHYPLFATVQEHSTSSGFRTYSTQHANRTGFVVFLPMFAELITSAIALLPWLRPAFLSRSTALTSAAMVVLIWISTGLVQVPLHTRLSGTATTDTVRRLVLSNWVRTGLWTARSALLLSSIFHAFG